jgi:hypothetical protein
MAKAWTIGKFLFHMQGQGLALLGHHIPKRRVILLDSIIHSPISRQPVRVLNSAQKQIEMGWLNLR